MELDLFTNALQLALWISAPLLGAVIIAGALAGVLQTLTQISDESISLGMRVVGICIAAVMFSSYSLGQLQEFAEFAWSSQEPNTAVSK